MKAYKVLLFILAVFVLLGVIGYFMPREGLTLGPVKIGRAEIGPATLGFVSPADLFFGEDSVAHYVAQADSSLMLDSAQKALLDTFERAKYEVVTGDNAISFPDNDPAWMDPVFTALRQAGSYPIRIIHYGDSQIEIDRITSELRHFFQSEFGGYGVGLVPAYQTVSTTAIHQSCDRDLRQYIVYAPDQKLKSRQYGPMGRTAELNGRATFTFSKINMRSTKPHTKMFGRIGILYENAEDNAEGVVRARGQEYPFRLEPGRNFICIPIKDSTDRATVTLTGRALIHGFMLDGSSHGVQVDNVAMRGCSGTVFTSINAESMQAYFGRFNVPLIIMQFGGNAMGYLKPGRSLQEYLKGLKRQFAYLHRLSPDAKILFIGPSDMSTKVNGRLQSYPQLPIVVDSLRQMCTHNGVAFWDMYSAMGGWNSMLAWVHASPQLAGPDYVHFTPVGAERVGRMLTNALSSTYEYYLMRSTNGQAHNLKHYEIDQINGRAYADGIPLPPDSVESTEPDTAATAAHDTIQ